ncbi:MAG: hypothetical protein QM638_05230 [Nocardioides sp.]|uniref:hypothetical protein n=1 Tax=Nocardioides sp. TaxID=35761 RepID=UPI0039E352F3
MPPPKSSVPDDPATGPHLTRRGTFGVAGLGGAGVLTGVALSGLSGCSASDTLDSLRAPTPATPSPTANPDQVLIDRVAAAMKAADASAPRAYARLHRRQLARLGPSSDLPHSTTVAGMRGQRRLPRVLRSAALEASSAELVRLFASAAAGQRQLLRARGQG